MKKLFYIIIGFILGSIVYSWATPPTRQNTYTSGGTISSSEVTNNEDTIFNYLQAGVDTIKDGIIVNADISSSANIQAEKLNLTAVAQNIANTGTLTNTGNVAVTGTLTITGTTNNCILTIDADGTCDAGTSIGADSSIAICAVCAAN